MHNLFPFQTAHAAQIEHSLRSQRIALDASEPGTGKTYVACAVAARLGYPIVIITTKATVPAWMNVAEGFGVKPELVINYEKLRTGKLKQCQRIGKQFIWQVPQNALLIFDEAQNCKGQTSLNSKLLIAAKRQHLRILLCSATAASSPLEMRALGFALGLHALADFWNWCYRHGVQDGVYGAVFYGGAEYLKSIHEQIFPAKGSRLRIADIEDFPDSLIEAAPIETGKARAIQKIYSDMKRELEMAESLGDRKRLHSLALEMDAKRPSSITIQLRARQAIELYKVDAMVEMAKSAVDEGMSVVLLVNFDATLEALGERLNTTSFIRGGQSEKERVQVIKRFQRNDTHIVIANIKAGGVGVSLHDPSGTIPRLSLISPTFSAADLRQALGRVHRTGGAASVQKIVFAAKTCEEHAAKACARKLANIDLLNDGDITPFYDNTK